MNRVNCPHCLRRENCRYRQPGTWVVDCDCFKLDPEAMNSRAAPGLRPIAQREGGGLSEADSESRRRARA